MCKKESASYCLSVPVFVHFSFFPKKFLSQFSQLLLEPGPPNFCIHLEGGQVYCVRENQIADVYFSFFFKFSFFPSLTPM